jgi:TRAP-type C4-dicarboxylate transport system substrate-binding protein
MSQRQFDRLPDDLQELVQKAAQESAVYQRSVITKMENEQIDKLEAEGMVITYPDKEPFLQQTKSVYEEFKGELGDDADLLQQIIDMK